MTFSGHTFARHKVVASQQVFLASPVKISIALPPRRFIFLYCSPLIALRKHLSGKSSK